MIQVTLYTKPGCHLCEEAKAALQQLQAGIPFTLHEQNILEDAEAFRRFQYLIPVVDIQGGPLLHPPLDALALQQALHSVETSSRE